MAAFQAGGGEGVLFRIKSQFDDAAVKAFQSGLASASKAAVNTATALLRLSGIAAKLATGFKILIAIKVAGFFNNVANAGIEAAQALKQFEYQTGISAGHMSELRKELGITSEQNELFLRSVKGDIAALRELERRNSEVANAIKRTGLETAQVAALSPADIYQALAASADIAESRVAALNERLADMADVSDDVANDWDEFFEQFKEDLGAAKDDLTDFLLNPFGAAEGIEKGLGKIGKFFQHDPYEQWEKNYQKFNDTTRGLIETNAKLTSGLDDTTDRREEVMDFYEGAANLSGELSDRLDRAAAKQKAFNETLQWLRDNGAAINKAARKAGGGIAFIEGKALGATTALERLGAALAAATGFENPNYPTQSELNDFTTRANLNLVRDKIGGTGAPGGIGGLGPQGSSGTAPAPEDQDEYKKHGYGGTVL